MHAHTYKKKNIPKKTKTKPTPPFFFIESLILVVTKPVYCKYIDNSHIPFFLEQINIFIISDSVWMCVLQCFGLFTLQWWWQFFILSCAVKIGYKHKRKLNGFRNRLFGREVFSRSMNGSRQ